MASVMVILILNEDHQKFTAVLVEVYFFCLLRLYLLSLFSLKKASLVSLFGQF